MLSYLADRVAKRLDIDKIANLVEVKLAERLDARIESKIRKDAVKEALRDRLKNPSKAVYGITGERIPLSGPYYLKEDPQYRVTFRKTDVFPHHKIGATKLQVTWIFDPPEES